MWAGFWQTALPCLSDATHMLADVVALLLGIVAFQFSSKPATKKSTFGFYRLEIFAAQINGGILLFLSLFIFYAAYQRLLHPEPIKGVLMLVVACVGLVANIAGAMVLHQSSRENLNVRAAFLHIVGDLISSVGVIVGGVIISLTGWFAVDPILSLMIGVIILKGAYGVVKETAAILLEAVPKHINLDKLIREVEAIEGVNVLSRRPCVDHRLGAACLKRACPDQGPAGERERRDHGRDTGISRATLPHRAHDHPI